MFKTTGYLSETFEVEIYPQTALNTYNLRVKYRLNDSLLEIDLTLPEYENRYHRKDQWLYLICNSFRNKNRYHIRQIRSMASFDLQFVLEQEQTLQTTYKINGFI